MDLLLQAPHTIYKRTLDKHSDFLSLFTQNFNEETYLGCPGSKFHDFRMGAVKSWAIQENMPNVIECIDALDVVELDKKIGFMQVIFESSITGKLEGLTHLTESWAVDKPIAF